MEFNNRFTVDITKLNTNAAPELNIRHTHNKEILAVTELYYLSIKRGLRFFILMSILKKVINYTLQFFMFI